MKRDSFIEPAPIDFYHAMIYVKDVEKAKEFYRLLGLELIDENVGFARARFPGGYGTLALHEPHDDDDRGIESPGIRLYFEVQDLEKYCEKLQSYGIKFDQPPQLMKWGWKHAYLRDPDGHEISLFYAGEERLRTNHIESTN